MQAASRVPLNMEVFYAEETSTPYGNRLNQTAILHGCEFLRERN
jgi:hypothetical protein